MRAAVEKLGASKKEGRTDSLSLLENTGGLELGEVEFETSSNIAGSDSDTLAGLTLYGSASKITDQDRSNPLAGPTLYGAASKIKEAMKQKHFKKVVKQLCDLDISGSGHSIFRRVDPVDVGAQTDPNTTLISHQKQQRM